MTQFILHEDEHLLVVNKPAGWNTHSPAPFAGEGVYDWLKHREPRWADLAIIHRLDKETSGVLVFGKTPLANKSLTQQFTERHVRKQYLLRTHRPVKERQFTVVSHLRRAGERYVSSPGGGADSRAETHFTVQNTSDRYTTLLAEPVTGRTHQIRVHAADRGYPIMGDPLYGGVRADRLYLHASRISFRDPETNEPTTFEAACPWDVPASDCLRAALVEPALTNAWRIHHGASDDYPGLYAEKLGPWLLAETIRPLTSRDRELLSDVSRDHRLRGVYHKMLKRQIGGASEDTSPVHLAGEIAPEHFVIRENGVDFEIRFNEGYSVGLFLDQRDNRRRFLVNHVGAEFGALFPRSADLRGARVLNTFAYTCGFSTVAAVAGAETTSLDLSKKYLEWGRRNFALNNVDPGAHDFIYGDAFDWMRRLAKKGRLFEVIVLDPPTFSRSRESGTWQAEKHYGRLIEAALPLLSRGGVILASTNAARLDPAEFVDTIRAAIQRSGRKLLRDHYVPQPPDFPISRDEPAYLKTLWARVG